MSWPSSSRWRCDSAARRRRPDRMITRVAGANTITARLSRQSSAKTTAVPTTMSASRQMTACTVAEIAFWAARTSEDITVITSPCWLRGKKANGSRCRWALTVWRMRTETTPPSRAMSAIRRDSTVDSNTSTAHSSRTGTARSRTRPVGSEVSMRWRRMNGPAATAADPSTDRPTRAATTRPWSAKKRSLRRASAAPVSRASTRACRTVTLDGTGGGWLGTGRGYAAAGGGPRAARGGLTTTTRDGQLTF